MKFPKLDLCCYNDDLRPSMGYVCVRKDYTFATDAHILVRHNTEEIFKEDFFTTLPEGGIMIHRNAFAIIRQAKTLSISLSEDKKTIRLHRQDGSTISYDCQPSNVNSPAPGYPLPKPENCELTGEIAVSGKLMSILAEGIGSPHSILRLRLYGPTKNILCDANGQGDYFNAIGVIMPTMIH